MDRGGQLAPISLRTIGAHTFDHKASWVAKVSKRVQTGKPNLKTPGGFELNFSPREARPHPFGAAMLNQARELFHRKPGLSDQRSKSPFGQFFMVGNGKASVRWVGVSK